MAELDVIVRIHDKEENRESTELPLSQQRTTRVPIS